MPVLCGSSLVPRGPLNPVAVTALPSAVVNSSVRLALAVRRHSLVLRSRAREFNLTSRLGASRASRSASASCTQLRFLRRLVRTAFRNDRPATQMNAQPIDRPTANEPAQNGSFGINRAPGASFRNDRPRGSRGRHPRRGPSSSPLKSRSRHGNSKPAPSSSRERSNNLRSTRRGPSNRPAPLTRPGNSKPAP